MTMFARFIRFARARLRHPGATSATASAEVWCRPATVLALRDRAKAPFCLAGWR